MKPNKEIHIIRNDNILTKSLPLRLYLAKFIGKNNSSRHVISSSKFLTEDLGTRARQWSGKPVYVLETHNAPIRIEKPSIYHLILIISILHDLILVKYIIHKCRSYIILKTILCRVLEITGPEFIQMIVLICKWYLHN